jgi:methylase of polypeptide subunit release factors
MSVTATVGGLAVEYDASVLEPRPWTAAQARWAAELSPGLPDGPLLELCTGVGHIGLLAATLTGRDAVLVDASPAAVAFARRNARQVGAAGVTIEVRHGPMTEVLSDGERFPLVLADPPYLRSEDVATYPDDPPAAVDGGPDGLSLARTCLSVAARHLADDGALVIQLRDAGQAGELGPTAGERGLVACETRVVAGAGALALFRRASRRQDQDQRARPAARPPWRVGRRPT